MPGFKPVIGDDYKTVFQAPIVDLAHELSDGTLLALSYGNFVGDDVPISGFETKLGVAPMYRTYMLSSNDDGKNWEYLSTIAYGPCKTGQESFCEPAIADFGGGELLVIMRTGRYAPLFQCRSLDGGQTWSEPVSLETLGPTAENHSAGQRDSGLQLRLAPDAVHLLGGSQRRVLSRGSRRLSEALQEPSRDRRSFGSGRRLRHVQSRQGIYLEPAPQDRRAADARYTRIAATGPASCVVLSYRFVLPGKSLGETLRIWENDSEHFLRDMKTLYEARRITGSTLTVSGLHVTYPEPDFPAAPEANRDYPFR